MTKVDFEQLKSTIKQWLFHTGSLDPADYVNELKLKFIEPREKRIAELETRCNELFLQTCGQAEKISELEKEKQDLEWHYMKDELPKDNEYVLIYTNLNNCYVARKVENHFMSKGWGFIPMSTIIAWKEIVLPKESGYV